MNKGFSLVELIVVIAIMAILVGVAVPVYTSYITKANNNVDMQLADDAERVIVTLLIDQDVKNPAAGTEITLTDSGFAIANADTDEQKFVAELNKLLPNVDLKNATSITFTIGADGYSVSNSLLDVADTSSADASSDTPSTP